jgi:transposase
MIVIGVDVHKHSLTAVAVDEAGRMLDERTVGAADAELLAWACELGEERLWAVEDCRQLTPWLERQLLAAAEALVRVPPKLMAPERRAGRARGKSDAIDALAVARAALREPGLSRPRPDEQPFRELKLLVDHREDLVDERRRAQQRLRWHLHQLDPVLCRSRPSPRPAVAPRSRQSLARTPRARRPGADRARARQPLPRAHALDRRARSRAGAADRADRARVARAAGLRQLDRCEAARRGRPDRPLQLRRAARPAQRRRAARGKLRPRPAPPARPRRQPPTQHRLLPNGDHTGPLPPAGARLPRTQTGRRQEQTRSDPLPQTPTRTRRLQHTESESRLDIGATLAQAAVLDPASRALRPRTGLESCCACPCRGRSALLRRCRDGACA